MNESISENKLRRRRIILTVLDVYKQPELHRLINVLNRVHNLSYEEVVKELKFMESEGLVRISEDTVALTSKGVEVVKEVGVDENLAKNAMEQLLVAVKPFLVAPALLKPRLDRLDAGLLDAKALKKPIYVFIPPKLSIHYPRVEKLDTLIPLREDLSKTITLIHSIQIVSGRSKPKLTELDRGVVEKFVGVDVKPLSIKVQNVKLTNLDKEFEVKGMHSIATVKPFLLAIPKPVRATLNSQEPTVKHEVTVSGVQKVEGKSVDIDEVADVIELFEFKEFEEIEPSFGLSTVVWDRPVIIVATKPKNYDYVDILRHILRILYRVAVGGLPHGEYLAQLGDILERSRLHNESFKEGVIRVIEINERSIDDLNLDILRDRLRELLVEGVSYTILYVDETVANAITKFVDRHAGEFGAKKFIIKPRTLTSEQITKLSALLWGYRNVPEKTAPPKSLDDAFTRFAEKYYNDLEQILSTATKMGYTFIVKPHKVEGPAESPEHYLLKVFTDYYFA